MTSETTILSPPADQLPFWQSTATSRGLTSDLLQDASRRLQVMGLVALSLWLVYFILEHWVIPPLRGEHAISTPVPHWLCLAGFLLSLALLLLGRSSQIRPQRLLDIGLVYMIGTAALIAVLNSVSIVAESRHEPAGVSWNCIWILLYPMIVPNTRRRVFLAAVIAASMDPLVLALHTWRQTGHSIPLSHLVFWKDNYICALLAVVPAHILQQMSRKVRRARQLGSYQLVELIGRGGMGEVWKAKHSMLARPAAIKIIRAEKLGSVSAETASMTLRRFEREAQATAALNSAHSIELFDYGLSKDGTFYYVMEYLNGFDVDTFVKRFGPMPSERAVHILLQVCHSLHDAHQTGLIHRDIKPANIFTCKKGQDFDFVKVLDFGLVKMEQPADANMLTMQGVTTGTPAFMAPEQITSQNEIDQRVDIYALGCVGYWLLTGQLVFEADNPMKMLLRHAQDTPVPPSMRTELPIPSALEKLLLSCLEKDPAGR
ncbi:MAG: serine/threonine-protein kinase, partial [Candidatus Krumholzibacteriia bacterium]